MGLLEPTREAIVRLLALDPVLWQVIWTSMRVALVALAIATPPAIAVGFLLAATRFPGRRVLITRQMQVIPFVF